ncbi:hypothetical protein BCR36DRAFT_584568 [Piromyces finnis]|uniref:TRAF3-interacting protein 1 n=1 Tax=Piromyces finnis TaxID=1754191 RepID=A0A1Y1V6C2_9FUNG|nr:hypothetical protein BCR36DRAFT_584568 [Piromyces finnis]|eukprot:ORX47862.1 hypothetical protein BCR36DRAFT_584568 [Piromyces finnis]
MDVVIQKTIKILKKSVKKTPLTPKLLGKPPFRYLHDIISEIIRNTGFAKELYNDEEKQSSNKDKEGKIKYLTKIINVVGILTNQSLKINPLKVVAGMEPDQTNIFLQLLGEVAITKVEESKDIVKRVLNGETMKKAPKTSTSQKKLSDGKLHTSNPKLADSKEKLAKTSKTDSKTKQATAVSSSSKHHSSSSQAAAANQKKLSNTQATSKGAQKSNESLSNYSASTQSLSQQNSSKKLPETSTNINTGSNQNNIDANVAKELHVENDKEDSSNEERKSIKTVTNKIASDNNVTSQNLDDMNINANNGNIAEPVQKVSSNDSNNGNERPRSRSQQNQQKTHTSKSSDTNVGGINENIPEANPDDQIDVAIEQETIVSHIIANSRYRERPASARPPPPKQRHTNIIQESPVKVVTPIVIQETSQQQDEEEENEYLIINQDNQDSNTNKSQLTKNDTKGNDQFGGLVQHILDTKKDLEGESNENVSSTLNKNENESKDMIHAKKDINSLRESIQFLCRNTNPLGKTMDYIQEDFDSMTKELEGWRSESIKYSNMLKTEVEITEETLKPLQEQLKEVEQNIAEELERINSQNATIIRNKEKIDKLLQSIVHPIR